MGTRGQHTTLTISASDPAMLSAAIATKMSFEYRTCIFNVNEGKRSYSERCGRSSN